MTISILSLGKRSPPLRIYIPNVTQWYIKLLDYGHFGFFSMGTAAISTHINEAYDILNDLL